MLEEAIYSISNHFTQLIVFLGFVLLLGIIIYIMTGKFDIHKKTSMYCGLLTGLNKKQILALCVILIRTFCIIYAVTIYSKNIGLSLVTIFLIDCIFILKKKKKILFEGINIIAQLIFIYLINVLKTYTLEISNDMHVEQISIVLSAFMIIYTVYFFLKNFEEIIRKKEKVRKNKKSSKKKNQKHQNTTTKLSKNKNA